MAPIIVGGQPGGPPGNVTETRPNSNLIASDLEIVNAARDAGFRDDHWPNDPVAQRKGPMHRSELAWAVAIALAESHGDRTAVGDPNDGHVYIGLWQIQRDNLDKSLFSPDANARAAFGLFDARGHKFDGTWSTFTSPASGFLVRAEQAVKATHKGPLIDVPFGDIAESVGALVSFLLSGQTWVRLGEAVGGFVILILSVWLLVRMSRG